MDVCCHYTLPSKFTFPFAYEPHPIAKYASENLMERIRKILDQDNMIVQPGDRGDIGKMFGVLVVKSPLGVLGYLSAFSGKWGEHYILNGFVPPIFDLSDPNGFYKKKEAEINLINQKISILESSDEFISSSELLDQIKNRYEQRIHILKDEIKSAKKVRDKVREELRISKNDFDVAKISKDLELESIEYNYRLKRLNKEKHSAIEAANHNIDQLTKPITELKELRREESAALQERLFECYSFVNCRKEHKNLIDIFGVGNENIPPSGAGECAAPKLLQYAFLHDYVPITMAEFWYGNSPSSEIRKHGHYYPACNSKCKPILSHMLEGTDTDPNPMDIAPSMDKDLPILFEDEYIIVVDKPTEFLSVPGKTIKDSVFSRVIDLYPGISGPVIIHRLDMSTSGILVVAKNKYSHEFIQNQFITHKIKKKYIAVLDGILTHEKGQISLPLRVDLEDRPRQMVCHTYGKNALTDWERVEIKNHQTKVFFYPKTGRTHQLRVHAAHKDGLGIPIKGDDIYGTRSDRLYLHASNITFVHPGTRQIMEIEAPTPF
jgi:tRNA pseudouridine32 synthase/23S rRNA pseudouridine746 synthase